MCPYTGHHNTRAGLSFTEPQTDTAFGRVWRVLRQSLAPVFHAIGNHELYNFKSGELRGRFNEGDGTQVGAHAQTHTDIHTCIQTDRQRDREREKEREADRWIDR